MKIPIAYNSKAEAYIKMYPKEFTTTKDQGMFCKLCSKIVNASKKFAVDSHRETIKHVEALKILESVGFSENPILQSARMVENKFLDLLVKAFTAADIPLFKLNCH